MTRSNPEATSPEPTTATPERQAPEPAELVCRELVELVTPYLEGALDPAERARLEGHLNACSKCRAYLSQMRQTIATLGRLPAEAVSAEAQADLLRVFRTWKGR